MRRALNWSAIVIAGAVIALLCPVWVVFLYSVRCTTVMVASCDCGPSAVQLAGDVPSVDETRITDSEADRKKWLEKRTDLLKNHTANKVLFFAYMRGGSTIGGEMFNQNNGAILWYEPADAFFMSYYGIPEENLPQQDLFYRNGTRRVLSSEEQSSLSEFLTDHFNCRYEELPPEATAHHFLLQSRAFVDYVRCLGPHLGKGNVLINCVRFVSPICGTTVETSAAEKCQHVIAFTKEVFRENRVAVDGIREAFRGGRPDVRELLRGMESRLMSKMASSGRRFDPRLSSRLHWFILHRLCLDDVKAENEKCVRPAVEQCQRSALRVLEVNRLHMRDVEGVVRRNPDVHVFYYVRDPRAIAVSRCNTEHLVTDIADFSPSKESRLVCDKMAADLRHFRALQARYPGAFDLVKYEDLVRDPEGTASRIYSALGMTPSAEWNAFAMREVSRRDTGNSVEKWRVQLSKSELDEMNTSCASVLAALQYDI